MGSLLASIASVRGGVGADRIGDGHVGGGGQGDVADELASLVIFGCDVASLDVKDKRGGFGCFRGSDHQGPTPVFPAPGIPSSRLRAPAGAQDFLVDEAAKRQTGAANVPSPDRRGARAVANMLALGENGDRISDDPIDIDAGSICDGLRAFASANARLDIAWVK